VPLGAIQPNEVHVPGIYVQRLIVGKNYEKRIEKLTLSPAPGAPAKDASAATSKADVDAEKRNLITRRAAKEFKDGMYGNVPLKT